MKLVHFISGFFLLLLLASCSTEKKSVATPALQFRWNVPQHFEVVETIQKKGNTFQIAHNCELVQTNDEFELQWLDAKIREVNGERVADSEELRRTVEPLEASFVYPAFRVNQSGQFLEATDSTEYMKKSDHMLDIVATNRDEDNRKFFTNFSKSETGKQVMNQFSAQIWQTWVEAWTDVELADGQSASATGMTPFAGGTELPATERMMNLGPVKSNTNLLSLKYEHDMSGTNIVGAINDFIEKMAKETELKNGAGPITNEFSMRRTTTLEVQTERLTLRPHWAKRTIRTIFVSPSEPMETELEVHEYRFQWNINPFELKK